MPSSLVTTRRSALHQELPSDPASPSLVRRAFSAWLRQHGVAEQHREDLVLAVSEAVSNVVDHAYRFTANGGLELDAELNSQPNGERWVTVAVTDYGAWREARAANGFRGRGLQMIRACTDWHLVERRAIGTRITMARRTD